MIRHAGRTPVAKAACAVFGALLVTSCTHRPLVEVRQLASPVPAALRALAVAPFYPGPTLYHGRGPGDEAAWAVASLVSRYVTEAIAERGIIVIAPNELETAFIGEGAVVPRGDGVAAAAVAHRSFGATGVMLGEVTRYRERSGTAIGSEVPASVGFRVTLYSAPDGKRLWEAVFDETQPSLTQDLLRARKYPGGGSRWLTAAELAQFGASKVAEALPQPAASAVPTPPDE